MIPKWGCRNSKTFASTPKDPKTQDSKRASASQARRPQASQDAERAPSPSKEAPRGADDGSNGQFPYSGFRFNAASRIATYDRVKGPAKEPDPDGAFRDQWINSQSLCKNSDIRTLDLTANMQPFKNMVITMNGIDVRYHTPEIEHSSPELNRGLDLSLESTKDYLHQIMPKLAKHELEALTTDIRQFYVKKYHRRRVPKYGSLDKGFDDYKLGLFFKAIDDDRFYMLFRYQAVLGLRVGEAQRLNLCNIDIQNRELKLKSEKSGRLDTLRIPEQLLIETIQYIRKYKPEIEASVGYLFFPDRTKQGYARKTPYFEINYIRNRFRHYAEKAKLNDDVYDFSDESNNERTKRRLHLLTTHSLRHYAITQMSKATNGNLVITSRFARHADPSTTMIYISPNKKQLYDAIDSVSINDIDAMKKRLIK